jgi:vacuolar-type H+-ATPase subunit I/STV1
MELTGEDIAVLLESLKYTIQRVSEAQGTPNEVRRQNLQRLEKVQEKLRALRKE